MAMEEVGKNLYNDDVSGLTEEGGAATAPDDPGCGLSRRSGTRDATPHHTPAPVTNDASSQAAMYIVQCT